MGENIDGNKLSECCVVQSWFCGAGPHAESCLEAIATGLAVLTCLDTIISKSSSLKTANVAYTS